MRGASRLACPICAGAVQRADAKLTLADFMQWLRSFESRGWPFFTGVAIPLALVCLVIVWWPGAVLSIAILIVGWVASRPYRATYECATCNAEWSWEEARLGAQRRDA